MRITDCRVKTPGPRGVDCCTIFHSPIPCWPIFPPGVNNFYFLPLLHCLCQIPVICLCLSKILVVVDYYPAINSCFSMCDCRYEEKIVFLYLFQSFSWFFFFLCSIFSFLLLAFFHRNFFPPALHFLPHQFHPAFFYQRYTPLEDPLKKNQDSMH